MKIMLVPDCQHLILNYTQFTVH